MDDSTTKSKNRCLAWLSGATAAILALGRAVVHDLAPRDLTHGFLGVDLPHRFIGTEPRDPREAHRVAGLMTIAGLDLIESDLDDGVGHDRAHAPVVLDGVLQKIARHLCDLLVRETGIRLSDVEKTVS